MNSNDPKQQQQQHQYKKLLQLSQYHKRRHNTPTIPKMQQQQSQLRFNLQLLRLLWLLVCFAGHCQALEHSAKFRNCYDKTSPPGQHNISSGWAPISSSRDLKAIINNNINNYNNNDNNNITLQTNQLNGKISDDLDHQSNLNEVSQMDSGAAMGWKCCCWNATHEAEVECSCEGEALTRVPQTLSVAMQRLTIASAGLPRLRRTGLNVYATSLLDVVLTDLKQLETIEDGAFANLKQLRTIYISHAPKLKHLSKEVFRDISKTIKFIRIINSGLIRVPDLIYLQPTNILQMVDLDNNHITRIDAKSINIKTEQLILANNDISFIDDSAFYGSQVATLTLKGNRELQEMHSHAFNGVSIQELDLSSTSLIHLPSVGLEDVEVLHIEDTQTLKTVPSIYYFKNLQKAYLTHSFHCCAFKFPSRHDPQRHAERLKEIQQWQLQCGANDNAQHKQKPDRTSDVIYSRFMRSDFPLNEEEFLVAGDSGNALEHSKGNNYLIDSINMEIGYFHDPIDTKEEQLDEYCGNFTYRKLDVECYPIPNALNPCEDVMGYRWLRIAVWIVVALSVIGNVAVLVVILSIRSEVAAVSRFLIAHLAFADLCLGLYLLLIASIDAYSMGKYFDFAYDWQYGAGCKVAGFLTVFASHLSVYTLTVITIERWMAITHALYLNYRIKLKQAAYVMMCGCLYSVAMSTLPLLGISNYSSTSICLPMEDGDLYDTIYLVAIMALNGMAFFIIVLCYAQIYMSLGKETRQAHGASIGEMTVAKKMALLVFTNFACWAPIAFFGLTALAGYPLINVTKSKILLVFFYPLNSCADPYLYALLTQQYRQDLYTLLGKFGLCKDRATKYKNSISFGAPSTQRHSTLSQKAQQTLITETQLMLKSRDDFV